MPIATCVSCNGCLVFDYCVVGNENFSMIESFKVTTMSESVEMRCKGVVTRIPDHSLMSWGEVGVDCVGEREKEEVESGVEKRYRVPEG